MKTVDELAYDLESARLHRVTVQGRCEYHDQGLTEAIEELAEAFVEERLAETALEDAVRGEAL